MKKVIGHTPNLKALTHMYTRTSEWTEDERIVQSLKNLHLPPMN